MKSVLVPLLLLSVVSALGQTAMPDPKPAPSAGPGASPEGQTSPVAAADLRPEVRVDRSWIGRERDRFTDRLECSPVPEELFHPGSEILPDGVPSGGRLAATGRTLGILAPDPPRGFKLTLVRKEKVAEELFLPLAGDGVLGSSPRFVLGEDGELTALKGTDGFVVYRGTTPVGVFHDADTHSPQIAFKGRSVYWCPWPPPYAEPGPPGTDDGGGEPKDRALWLRSELDGSERKVLLRVDARKLDEEEPHPGEQAMTPVVRPDGKFWLAGLNSGEIVEASKGESVTSRWLLPYRLATEENDPKAAARAEAEAEKDWNETRAADVGDATRRPVKKVTIILTLPTRIIGDAFAKDRDLVLTTTSVEPLNALLIIRDDGLESARCLVFPKRLGSPNGWLNVAVTSDDLWFASPFGYFSWVDLEAILDASERRDESGAGAPAGT